MHFVVDVDPHVSFLVSFLVDAPTLNHDFAEVRDPALLWIKRPAPLPWMGIATEAIGFAQLNLKVAL